MLNLSATVSTRNCSQTLNRCQKKMRSICSRQPWRKAQAMTDLMERMAALSETKKRLLELRLTGAKWRVSADTSSETEHPLSPLQEIMWMEQSRQPGSAILNVPLAFRLRGELNHQALQHAVDEVVRRHEILRTRYVVREGKPIMVVTQERVAVKCRAGDVPSDGQKDQVGQTLVLEGTRPFNLERELPFRVMVFESGSEEHVL